MPEKFPTEFRPWGFFETLVEDYEYKVKRLTIGADSSISLQFHLKREEHWIIVAGDAEIVINDEVYLGYPGDSFFIDKGEIHRINAGVDGVIIIEIQMGECEEDDIVRLDDKYGRRG